MKKAFIPAVTIMSMSCLVLSALLFPGLNPPTPSSHPTIVQEYHAAVPQLTAKPQTAPPQGPSSPQPPQSKPPASPHPASQTADPATDHMPSVLPGKNHVNYPYKALLTPNDSLYSSQWALSKTNAPTAWNTTTGNSTPIIAVIDTGFALSNPDLANHWWTNSGEIGPTTRQGPAPNCTSRGLPLDKSCNNLDNDGDGYPSDWRGWDFSNNDNDPSAGTTNPSSSAAFHGTFVSGIAAATGNNASGVAGVSWAARIMPLEALDDTGNGFTDTIAAAVIYAVAHGANIINLSLGTSYDDPYLHQVIDNAIAAGVTVVGAAGNDGCNCLIYPANYPEVISVGASDQTDSRASFSSYGNNLDIVAPGVNICSALWTSGNPNGFGCGGSGTSFATPMVSGAIALMLSQDPQLSPSDIARLLAENADKVAGMNGASFSPSYGYGRLDVASAVSASSNAPPGGQLLSKSSVSLSSPFLSSGPLMDSTCIGIAHASCTITLIGPSNQVVVVGTTTLDDNGGANFQWNASSLGITLGQWKAQASMTFGGQTTLSNIQVLQVN